MRVLRYLLIGFLAALFCLSAQAAQNQGRLRFLAAPGVSWKDNRLTGELKNVPISGLLEDLIKSKHFDCAVNGQLKGSISFSFENLTVEEIIHKIMRINKYNYTLLTSPASANTKDYPGIGKLSIYQGDSIISFSRVPLGTHKARMVHTAAHRQSPLPAKESPDDHPITRSDERHAEEIIKLDGEIKGLLDEMVESKEMSKEDYKKAMATMKAHPKE